MVSSISVGDRAEVELILLDLLKAHNLTAAKVVPMRTAVEHLCLLIDEISDDHMENKK